MPTSWVPLKIPSSTQSALDVGGIVHPVVAPFGTPISVSLQNPAVEHPVVSAACQGLRRIILLVHRRIGDEQRAHGAGEDLGRPVRRGRQRRAADNEAAGREYGSVRTGCPCGVLCTERQRRRGGQQGPTPSALGSGSESPSAKGGRFDYSVRRVHHYLQTVQHPACPPNIILRYRSNVTKDNELDTLPDRGDGQLPTGPCPRTRAASSRRREPFLP